MFTVVATVPMVTPVESARSMFRSDFATIRMSSPALAATSATVAVTAELWRLTITAAPIASPIGAAASEVLAISDVIVTDS